MLSTVKKYEIRHFLRYKKNHTIIINFKKTPLPQKKTAHKLAKEFHIFSFEKEYSLVVGS